MAASESFKAGQSLCHEPGLNGAVGDRTNKKPATSAVHEEEDLSFSGGDDDDDDGDGDYWTMDPMMIKTNGDIRELDEPSISDPRDAGTADHWVQRSPSLVRLTGKHPFNSEPPLSRLMQVGFITPAPLHYVRNHGPVPRATWDGWRVEVTGLVRRPARFTMDQLVSEFPAREFPATLVCAGNRRKEQNMVKQTIGFNWGAAGVSTSVWRGAPLRRLLRRCGIMRRRDGAAYVCFEGAEELPGGGGGCKYATSVRREVAMDPGRDILVAYMQNGERLLPDHGFPVRIIIPGFIGGRMVKWLKRIVVTPKESDTHYHYNDNRVLPSHVDAELANAQAWWYKPEYIINELNVNSVITSPCHGEVLAAETWMIHQPYTLRGYAYSGGGRRVTRVEVTTNGGESWHVCRLDQPEKPNSFGKYWCWSFWWLEFEVLGLLEAQEIAVRAWDESHNTQPEKLIWNVMGMMNNCWFRVKARVSKSPNGDIGIVFRHPTLPASQPGGWMIKPSESDSALQTHKTTLPSVNNSTTVSLRELKKHDSPDSAWIAVNRKVYDCTRFLNDHPGGADSILINAGTDCTEEFEAIHSDKAKRLLRGYLVGELLPECPPEKPGDSVISNGVAPGKDDAQSTGVALAGGEKIECRLVSKTDVSRDVRRFRFALPSEDQVLGLPVGKHIFLCATVRGKLCLRAYTPTTAVDQVGFFDLVVRIYFAGEDPKFPNGGVMSQYLDSMHVGSTVGVKGPLGHVEYAGRGVFTVHGGLKFARKLAMVAGGTGITPIYQVIQEVLRDPQDQTEMHLVYACRTEEDILLREELDGWAEEAAVGERLRVWYVVGRNAREGWRYGVGRVTEETLRGHLPAAATGVVALACGPPEMIESAVRPIFEKMNYAREALIVF